MNFEKLDVWKRAVQLSSDLYSYCNSLKDRGFKDQVTRSGLSIPSNIAEGMERGYSKEKIKFLRYAKGSCGELKTQIYIGLNIGYIDRKIGCRWIDEVTQIASMITGLIKRIESETSG